MFLFPFLFVWFLFVLFSSVLCQLSNSFFLSCFRWNHCFLVFFFCFYFVFSCRFLFILFSISVVTHWLLVFCIFIYSCNYILVFFHFIEPFFITSLSDVMISCCFSYILSSSAYNIFVLFIVIIFFAAILYFCFYSFSSWLYVCVCVIISLCISLII